MADAAAPLNPSVVLAKTAKFFRVMEAEGAAWPHFQLPIDSVVARRNLAEFLKKGCPDMGDGIVGLLPSAPDISILLTNQYSFYRQFFGGWDLDFSSVPIPTHQPGLDRLIIVAQGLTPNQVYNVCTQHFRCWRYTGDLDAALDWDQEERNPKDGTYAIWVRDRQEADGELQNLSANQIKKRAITTETLTERLLHGLMFWSETKQHLDTDNITYCSGSRRRDARVPGVFWVRRNGEVFVSHCNPDDSDGHLRARVVVS